MLPSLLPPPSSHSHPLLPGIAQMLTLVKVIASIGHFLIQDPSLRWLVACLARLVSELVKYLCDSVIGLVGDFCRLVEYLGDSVIGQVEYLGDSVIGLVGEFCRLVEYLGDSVIDLVECLGDSVISLVGDFCHLVKCLGDSVIGQVGEFLPPCQIPGGLRH